MDDETSWKQQLLVGLAALVVVAVLVGGILAVIALRTADYVGIGDTSTTSSPEPIFPTTGSTPPSTGITTPSPTTPTTTKPPPPAHPITLSASPRSVGSFDRIDLTGSYPRGDGATLQVQRSVGDGAWGDFPTHTTVRNGEFATYVQTAMAGVNHFRMVDEASGTTSNAVSVTIG